MTGLQFKKTIYGTTKKGKKVVLGWAFSGLDNYSGSGTKLKKCPHCRGSGNLYYQPCDFCGGSGQKRCK